MRASTENGADGGQRPRGWAALLGRYALPVADAINSARPFIVLDDLTNDGGSFLLADPERVLVASVLDEVADVLAEARAEAANGKIVAGFLSYEAGAAFEPRLREKLLVSAKEPLAWLGCFRSMARLSLESPRADAFKTDTPHIRSGWSDHDHDRATREILRYITDGDIYQANLTFIAHVGRCDDPIGLYLRIRARQSAGWGGLVWTGAQWLLSFSPEQFFSLADGKVECRPMKGTAPRRPDATADQAERTRLRDCPKERAENLMIVDLIRNDLSRMSRPGSVRVPELFRVESYPTVHQMTSCVTAHLTDGNGAFDLLETCFPCGSVTGAPKIRAMEILAELEPHPRGSYTGSLGLILPDGNAAFNVIIRTLAYFPDHESGTLHVGSGVTSGSQPELEWNECLTKLKFFQTTGGITGDDKPVVCGGDPFRERLPYDAES